MSGFRKSGHIYGKSSAWETFVVFMVFKSTAIVPCESWLGSISQQQCYSESFAVNGFYSKRESFPPQMFPIYGTCLCTHVNKHTDTFAHTLSISFSHKHARMHTYSHTHKVHMCIYIHTSYTYTHAHTHTHTYSHICINVCTHTHTHTCT